MSDMPIIALCPTCKEHYDMGKPHYCSIPMRNPDLKTDLLDALGETRFPGSWKQLRARLQSATITEPPAPKEEKNPKWPRAVVNNALDLLEIRALNAGDVALAQHARQVLEEMPDPERQAPPPEPPYRVDPVTPEVALKHLEAAATEGCCQLPQYWTAQRAAQVRAGFGDYAPSTPKTDAELLAELRAELGEGWGKETICHPDTPDSYCFRLKQSWVADVTAVALRKHGPRAVADALRLLAGSDQ